MLSPIYRELLIFSQVLGSSQKTKVLLENIKPYLNKIFKVPLPSHRHFTVIKLMNLFIDETWISVCLLSTTFFLILHSPTHSLSIYYRAIKKQALARKAERNNEHRVSILKKCSHIEWTNAMHIYLLEYHKTTTLPQDCGQHLDLADLCPSRFKGHQCFFCF